ncbi:hypothetical protein [Paenibacillus macerans]|uniref:hypothetical protein n=1 Tax=Paenibacillus macerans TaxID=44252 RepID=UPI0020425E49|nr:hypothetical protein [Paenibacillus macerans]MCM3703808.1 hypothetical protein [Paenibacillus macerans]
MKLHKDGTIEGTPQEIALYNKLTEVKKEPFKVIPPTTLYVSDFHTPAGYVRGLFAAIGSKDNLH